MECGTMERVESVLKNRVHIRLRATVNDRSTGPKTRIQNCKLFPLPVCGLAKSEKSPGTNKSEGGMCAECATRRSQRECT